MSINVTTLKSFRLEAILQHHLVQESHVILLQELRLHTEKPGWAIGLAQKSGWRIACSSPSDAKSNGWRQPGGTAVLWRPSLGKAVVRRHESHRLVGVRFDEWSVVSGYGPVDRPSIPWFEEALEFTEKLAHGVSKWFLGGDLNWRQVYANSLRENEVLCSMRQATTVMNTFPDRVVSKNIKVEHLNSEVIPGIPTHLLLEFSASMEPPERGVTKLKRTATFELNSDKLLDEEVQTQMRIEVEDAHRGEENETLPAKWERWHMKAENFSMTESKWVISSLQAKLKGRKAARHHRDRWRLSRRGEEATR